MWRLRRMWKCENTRFWKQSGNLRLRRCGAEFIPLKVGRMWEYKILEKI